MNARILLDTHVLLRWIEKSARLPASQLRVLRASVRGSEPVGVSAMTLLEIAQLARMRVSRYRVDTEAAFGMLEASETIEIIPISVPVAREVAFVTPVLRDPADSVIVATARVHGLRLLTSDQRIIDSRLASVIE